MNIVLGKKRAYLAFALRPEQGPRLVVRVFAAFIRSYCFARRGGLARIHSFIFRVSRAAARVSARSHARAHLDNLSPIITQPAVARSSKLSYPMGIHISRRAHSRVLSRPVPSSRGRPSFPFNKSLQFFTLLQEEGPQARASPALSRGRLLSLSERESEVSATASPRRVSTRLFPSNSR